MIFDLQYLQCICDVFSICSFTLGYIVSNWCQCMNGTMLCNTKLLCWFHSRGAWKYNYRVFSQTPSKSHHSTRYSRRLTSESVQCQVCEWWFWQTSDKVWHKCMTERAPYSALSTWFSALATAECGWWRFLSLGGSAIHRLMQCTLSAITVSTKRATYRSAVSALTCELLGMPSLVSATSTHKQLCKSEAIQCTVCDIYSVE